MEYSVNSTFNETDSCWDISVSGEIDIFNSNDFKEKLILFANEKPANINIDCTRLQYIDSTALGSLVAVLKTVKAYGGEIKLYNVKSSIIKLFKITNLDKVFVVEGDIHE